MHNKVFIVLGLILASNSYSNFYTTSNLNRKPTLTDQLNYTFGLTYRKALKVSRNSWWTEVNNNIILGAIPFDKEAKKLIQHGSLKNKKVAILGIVENWERRGALIYKPTPLKKLQKMGFVKFDYMNNVKDYTDVLNVESFKEGLEILKANEQKGYITLVHCKSGVGRSASLVIAKLIVDALVSGEVKIENSKYSTYLDIVQKFKKIVTKKRPTVGPGKQKEESIIRFIEHLNTTQSGQDWLKKYSI